MIVFLLLLHLIIDNIIRKENKLFCGVCSNVKKYINKNFIFAIFITHVQNLLKCWDLMYTCIQSIAWNLLSCEDVTQRADAQIKIQKLLKIPDLKGLEEMEANMESHWIQGQVRILTCKNSFWVYVSKVVVKMISSANSGDACSQLHRSSSVKQNITIILVLLARYLMI